MGHRSAPLFAHLKLQGDPVQADALLDSPVLAGARCPGPVPTPSRAAFILAELGVSPS